MTTKVKIVLAFVGGTAVGSLATYYLVRESFRKQADDEIQSVRDIYMKREAEDIENMRKKEGIPDMTTDEIVEDCFRQIHDLTGRTASFDDEYVYDEVNPVEYPDEGIEEVDESEFFNGYEDYETAIITLYTDGVLTNENEDVIDDQRVFFGDLDLQSYELGDDLYFVNHTIRFKIELIVSKQNYKRDVLGEDDEEGDYVPGDFADKSNN
jgi:hypothetical protein